MLIGHGYRFRDLYVYLYQLDYEKRGQDWNKMVRSSAGDWKENVETIIQWSPFASEADLLRQFNVMKKHGTRVFVYNLWEVMRVCWNWISTLIQMISKSEVSTELRRA